MPILCDEMHCSGCHACFNICPTKSISMSTAEDGFLYPKIDKRTCIECGICEKVCAKLNETKNNGAIPRAFAAHSKEKAILENSSSGGLFYHIAKCFIENGGVVFGAAFDEGFNVIHKSIYNIQDIAELQGSKYVQSTIGNTYTEAKKLLDSGKKVLFTGTPCQIEGLYSFVGKEYDNLYTQDIICHGVPSPKVWQLYLKHHKNKADSKLNQVSFRNKKSGWKTYSVLFEFSNNTEYSNVVYRDAYMRGFLADLYLRRSCYNCAAKGLNRKSDITLADFWGVEKVLPEMYDKNGTSLVLVHSKKGESLFRKIAENIKVSECDVQSAVEYNSAAIKSVKPHKKRNEFFDLVTAENFEEILNKCLKISLFQKIKTKVKNIFIKFSLIKKG